MARMLPPLAIRVNHLSLKKRPPSPFRALGGGPDAWRGEFGAGVILVSYGWAGLRADDV